MALFSLFAPYHSELLSFLLLLCCYSCIAGSVRYYGRNGLLVFSLIALIVSDFQVLCAAPFTLYGGPLVLGTVMYSSMFLVNDLITELYGLSAAKENIILTILGHLMLIGFLALTLNYPDLPEIPENTTYIASKNALSLIFHPQMGIFLASQCAYFISQWSDIHIFSHLRKKLPQVLAVRAVFSVGIGIIIDTLLFNFLAWRLFTESPIAWTTLWTDYIFANIVLQFIILFLNIPVFYGILRLIRSS